jgi:hypothetical protein
VGKGIQKAVKGPGRVVVQEAFFHRSTNRFFFALDFEKTAKLFDLAEINLRLGMRRYLFDFFPHTDSFSFSLLYEFGIAETGKNNQK